MSEDELALNAIVSAVAASRRYRGVAPVVVRRLAQEEAPKARNNQDWEKRVKRRLHQIFGAYVDRTDYARVLQRLQDAADDAARRAVCRDALAAHASTRERLPILEAFYQEIFNRTGPVTSVLDIGCGLNPLAIPWMALRPAAHYLALDIDLELVAFLDAALSVFDVRGQARVSDVVAETPPEVCDLALLLKTVPCLEQQRAGVGRALLAGLNARWVVVTYPTRSLGGHSKGMARTYRESFARLAAGTPWRWEAFELPGELGFVVNKHAGIETRAGLE